MTNLATAKDVLQCLAEAVPDTWRQDRVFRGAVIGAGFALAALLVRSGAMPQNRPLPPFSTLPASLSVIPGPNSIVHGIALPTQSLLQPSAPPAEVPKITRGHSLGDVTVAPTPDNDRFGTFKPEKHP